MSLGAVVPLKDGGKLDMSVFGRPFEKVWQDPYLLGDRREDTDKTTYGAKLVYSNILGTPTKVSYSLANVDVDDDEIGERFDVLERDGWLHEAQIAYVMPVGRGMSFVPSFEFSLDDSDGDANSYKGYGLKLRLRKFSSGYMFNISSTGIGLNDYDKTHPIFDKTREDISYSAFAVFTRSNLLGKKPLFSSLIAGYSSSGLQYRLPGCRHLSRWLDDRVYILIRHWPCGCCLGRFVTYVNCGGSSAQDAIVLLFRVDNLLCLD